MVSIHRKDTDFDEGNWEDFSNPVSEDSEDFEERKAKPARASTLGGSSSTFDADDRRASNRGRSRRGSGANMPELDHTRSAASFEDEGSPTATKKEMKRQRSKYTEPKPILIRRERDLQAATLRRDQGAQERINTGASDRSNRRMEGVLQDSSYEDRGHNVSLDVVDWTEEDRMDVLKMEARERGEMPSGWFPLISFCYCAGYS